VFKALEKMGFPQASHCFHLSYGMVVLESGKMSSRAGTVITFKSLKVSMEKELDTHLEKYRGEWSMEELASARHKLCAGAIKYGMLASDPTKDIVFNLKDWLSFEGDTGPYLMYAYARAKSILRKAAEIGAQPDYSQLQCLATPEEDEVMRHLHDFNATVKVATDALKPSILAHHLFTLAKAFSRFHREVPVLKAPSDAERGARLALTQAFAKILKTGLGLLGIDPPERM
jgi:arginyl-tRNA synthetase